MVALLLTLQIPHASSTDMPQVPLVEKTSTSIPFQAGETLTYGIFYKGLKIGTSTLAFHGIKTLADQDFFYVTFKTETPGFKDLEEIYAEKETFLPKVIKRTIRKFGAKPMTIEETYSQKEGKVSITKTTGKKSQTTVIEKQKPLSNGILLSYHYRTRKNLQPTEQFVVDFPLLSLTIEFLGIKKVKFAKEMRDVLVFQSIPADKFILWLSTDKERTPLRIENPGVFGYTMILKDKRQHTPE